MSARQQTAMSMALGLAVLAGWLVLHVISIFFYDLTGSLWLTAGVVVLQTWLSAGLFIIAHDCMHGSFAPGRPRLNRAIGRLCAALYACFAFGGLDTNHHRHHGRPGTADDPDFNAHDPRSFLGWYLHFFAGYYSHTQILWITAMGLIYLALGAGLLNILIFWAVPALLASVQLFLFGTWLPHRHGAAPFADSHNARSTNVGWVTSLVTCFHFGGFHHEHHLHPGLPWWALPQARKRAE